ncbi:MAG: hypothetical protein II564_01340 [Oscillospiraceae bacterium]|nr:hypothetical protein [Oscillospiraceae bacterium]
MKKRTLAQRWIAGAAAGMLLLCCGCSRGNSEESISAEDAVQKAPAPVYELTEEKITKDETVYTNLASDGSLINVVVTDHLHSSMPEVRVQDRTNLTDIRDTRTDLKPVTEKDAVYWDMSSTDLYYSGSTKAEPPVGVEVRYYLDGEEKSAEQIRGKNGDVRVEITVDNRIIKSDGSGAYHCPMLFMGGMILPMDQFEEITVSNGLMMGDGERQIVFFVGVPGMNESLNLDSLGAEAANLIPDYSHYTVSAKAKDFSLGNIMMAAVPFSSLRALGGIELSESLEGIKGVMTDIDAVMASISSLGVQDLIQMIYGDATQAQQLLNAVSDAQSLYRENQAMLQALSDFASAENLSKMERLIQDIGNMDTGYLQPLVDSQLYQQWLNWLSSLGGNIGSAADLLRDLQEVKPVLDQLNETLSSPEVAQAMEKLPETKQRLQNLVDAMNSSQELFDRMQQLTGEGARTQIGAITGILQKYSLLDSLSEEQAKSLAGRVQSWIDYGKEYTIFTEKTDQQDTSVVFVFKVAAAE